MQLTEGVLMEERYTTNPQYTSAGASSETVPSTVPLIERSTITDLQEIGEGFFGKVYKGVRFLISLNRFEFNKTFIFYFTLT